MSYETRGREISEEIANDLLVSGRDRFSLGIRSDFEDALVIAKERGDSRVRIYLGGRCARGSHVSLGLQAGEWWEEWAIPMSEDVLDVIASTFPDTPFPADARGLEGFLEDVCDGLLGARPRSALPECVRVYLEWCESFGLDWPESGCCMRFLRNHMLESPKAWMRVLHRAAEVHPESSAAIRRLLSELDLLQTGRGSKDHVCAAAHQASHDYGLMLIGVRVAMGLVPAFVPRFDR
ncbi:hypothetical protein EBT31_20640 [bacterium]|nr:hypothetical protein [bacterium]